MAILFSLFALHKVAKSKCTKQKVHLPILSERSDYWLSVKIRRLSTTEQKRVDNRILYLRVIGSASLHLAL